jgi:hypothetical protein
MKISTIPLFLMLAGIVLSSTECKKERQDPRAPIIQSPVVANRPPVVDAGRDITIAIPTTSAKSDLTITDPDVNLKSVKWEKISGPSSGYSEIESDWRSASAYRLEEGVYEFELTATDSHGLFDKDTARVTVTSNFRKYIKHALLPDASLNTTVEIPEEINNNLKWVYCRSGGYCESADKGAHPGFNYVWEGWYYESLPDNKLFVFGGSPNEPFDLIIYY